ncbi:MAG: molybdenum cofactor guanylyltransferase [Rhizobiaceae bacterium]|nr:molybdenum cofactor guanylyltransferase [Rhizobiaceae bacterium]
MTRRSGRIAGLVLAGGRSSRMDGRDKAGLILAGSTLLERAIVRLEPQVEDLAINSNTLARHNDLPIIADRMEGYAGPLAGVAAGLAWASESGAQYLATVACDTPFYPKDLVEKLSCAEKPVVLASSFGRLHPVFALWPVSMAELMDSYLLTDARRSVLGFANQQGFSVAKFEVADESPDPFFNINTPQDFKEAEQLARNFS